MAVLRPAAAPIEQAGAIQTFSGDGATLLATACAHGLEGLVAKRKTAPYRAGRHLEWRKIKCLVTRNS